MRSFPVFTKYLAVAAALLLSCVLSIDKAVGQDSFSKTVDGLTVYLGVLPAELTKGPPSHTPAPQMHGGVPRGAHEFHIVAAIFDAASNARIVDAAVTAQVSGLGLAGTKKTLEAMQIAGTTTYGGFFDLPAAIYTR